MATATLRMAPELLERLNGWARKEGRSLNDLATSILERELQRQERREALLDLLALGDELEARHGRWDTDAVAEIGALRQERAERG